MSDENPTLVEFKRLLWEGRRLQSAGKEGEARDLLEQAIKLAEEAGLGGEANIARASILEMESKYDEANTAVDAALADPGFALTGEAWHLRGSIHESQEEHDAAIECYRKATETPGYDTPGNSWFNMGSAYGEKEEFDKAIECYQKAVDSPGYETPGIAWTGMGLAFLEKKEFDKAIECCTKAGESLGDGDAAYAFAVMALAHHHKGEFDKAVEYYLKAVETPGFDASGEVWSAMGLACYSKKEFDKAIDCFGKAIESPGFDALGTVQLMIGGVYLKKGKISEALEAWEKAVNLFRQAGDAEWASIAESMIRSAKMAPELRSPVEDAILKDSGQPAKPAEPGAAEPEPSVESRMLSKISSEEEDCYRAYRTKQPESGRKYALATLRGFSSSVPVVGDATREEVRGGGYMLKWRGKALVIDPGFDFLRNFHARPFNVCEIDAVIVTHNHTDHNFDMRAIDDLRYELGRRGGTPEEREQWKYHLLVDEDSIPLLPERSESGYQPRMPKHFDTDRLRDYRAECHDLRELRCNPLPFCVKYFKTIHTSDVPRSIGLRVECFDEGGKDAALIVGYSSDTEYSDDLCTELCLGGCNILIAHISQPDPDEFADPTFLKKKHLGYRGVQKLIDRCKPRLTLVGEFWAGLADLRIDLTKGLRALCETDAILPCDINLMINPKDRDNLKIWCTNCDVEYPIGEITVTSPPTPFGRLGYLCKNCRA